MASKNQINLGLTSLITILGIVSTASVTTVAQTETIEIAQSQASNEEL
jgi:hypothetical protein